MTNRKAVLLAAMVSLLAVVTALGQTTTATLSGWVRDASGAVVPNARISALILPNQARGQIGALQVFTLNLGGLILGPFLPGFFNDYLFRDARLVGWSLALTVGPASLLSALLFRATWRPYRKHYAQMHGGQRR